MMREQAYPHAFATHQRQEDPGTERHVNLRFIDWIWHVKGSLPLPSDQSNDEAFDRLVPLFHKSGTSHQRTGDTLAFQKKDQAAQDKMSIFDDGVLRIERSPAGPVLRYRLTSRALLFCFLAPLLFLSIAQFTRVLVKFGESKPGATAEAQKKPAVKTDALPQNPIDAFLGSPAPEKPKKDKDKDKAGGRGKAPSPTPAYVFAGIFASLYVAGRILEDRLIKALFRKMLSGRQV